MSLPPLPDPAPDIPIGSMFPPLPTAPAAPALPPDQVGHTSRDIVEWTVTGWMPSRPFTGHFSFRTADVQVDIPAADTGLLADLHAALDDVLTAQHEHFGVQPMAPNGVAAASPPEDDPADPEGDPAAPAYDHSVPLGPVTVNINKKALSLLGIGVLLLVVISLAGRFNG